MYDKGSKRSIARGESTQPSAEKWFPWSTTALAEVCVRKGIQYEETSAFTNLRGVAVTCDETPEDAAAIICVQAALPEAGKVFTIGQLLGHLALQHRPAAPIRCVLDRDLPDVGELSPLQDAAADAQASVWAAHLLVQSDVYEQALGEVRASGDDERSALDRAIGLTSERLNIPREAVSLWVQTRDKVFPVAPLEWLAQSLGESENVVRAPSE